MGGDDGAEIVRLLSHAQQGDSEAARRLFPLAYAALQQLARRMMRQERQSHTLQPTALVHEAYLKILNNKVPYNNREHFLRAAAEAMRRILVDHAKARGRDKRGGGQKPTELNDCHLAVETNHEDLLSIDEVICRLEQVDSDAAALVRMRFYIGLTLEEIAEARSVSLNTIRREWAYARAFLFRELKD